MSGRLSVIGVDARPVQLPGGVRLAVGGDRHLAGAVAPDGCETLPLGPLAPALERLHGAARAGQPVAVLASGDPGFFGIVRRLRAEGFDLDVVPAVSSVALAFARIGRAWDGAAVVSAHGRALTPALNACRALAEVAVLTEPGASAAELGAGLAGWDRHLVVAENLGTDAERVTEVSPAQAAARGWAHPHVVVCLAPEASDGAMRADNQPAAAPAEGWARPESAYEHRDSMITKMEVRALVVARLRPRLGRLVWDVGAGSGSVGIECAGLGAAVVAVDDDPAACVQVRRNAATHGVGHAVRVVEGAAPTALADLPDPDAVFVGGGGPNTAPILDAVIARHPHQVVVAVVALDRVAPVVDTLRRGGFAVEGCQLSASRLADLPDGSLRLAATNPVVVLTGERP